MREDVARQPDFERLGDLFPAGEGAVDDRIPSGSSSLRAAGDAGADTSDLNRRVAAVWPDAVGEEIAANARPVQLREGRLVVTTSSSAWAQSLQLMSELVVAHLNEKLGAVAVKKVVFRHAGWEEFSAAGAVATEVADSADVPPASRSEAGGPQLSAPKAGSQRLSDHGRGGLSEEEARALADLETLPLSQDVKQTIREAMLAGFVRARQDHDR